ncbi:MAG: Zn-dependent protease with chaperone function [Halobacteriales archaeon]|jgi:Zn-dependent protease with chaperone function
MDGKVGWSLREKGTRLYARVYFGPVEAVQEYETGDDESIPVFLFSDDAPVFGQATVFRTIILNETQVSRLSDRGREYVVQHELGHLQRPPFRTAVFWGLIVSCFVLSLAALTVLLTLLRSGVSSTLVLVSGLTILSSILSFVLASRIEETAAELFALRNLGEAAFLESKREIRPASEQSVFTRLFVLLMYPRAETVVKIDEYVRRIRGYL